MRRLAAAFSLACAAHKLQFISCPRSPALVLFSMRPSVTTPRVATKPTLNSLPTPILLDIAILFTALAWALGFYLVDKRVYFFASLAIGCFVCACSAPASRACAIANGSKHHLGRTFKRGCLWVDSGDGPGVFELRSHSRAREKEVFHQDGRFDAKQVICEERDTKWKKRITSSLR